MAKLDALSETVKSLIKEQLQQATEGLSEEEKGEAVTEITSRALVLNLSILSPKIWMDQSNKQTCMINIELPPEAIQMITSIYSLVRSSVSGDLSIDTIMTATINKLILEGIKSNSCTLMGSMLEMGVNRFLKSTDKETISDLFKKSEEEKDEST